MPFKYPSPLARIKANSRTDENGCWIWLGCLNSKGRPLICVRMNGQPRNMLVTTFILERIHKLRRNKKFHVGAHSCDNQVCVNPEHITRATQRKNMRDCLERGRHNSQMRQRADTGPGAFYAPDRT